MKWVAAKSQFPLPLFIWVLFLVVVGYTNLRIIWKGTPPRFDTSKSAYSSGGVLLIFLKKRLYNALCGFCTSFGKHACKNNTRVSLEMTHFNWKPALRTWGMEIERRGCLLSVERKCTLSALWLLFIVQVLAWWVGTSEPLLNQLRPFLFFYLSLVSL